MYSDKAHINYLTRILLNQGTTDIVVCPGARNAPLCHNFHQAGFLLHPVTDERSAAFVALGIYLETKRPTIVCVTSGSALLNTLPAVAEAYYRHIPLIVISADRPKEWIGHLDGQTIPQQNALIPYAKCINIPEDVPLNNLPRKIAEELRKPCPLHINVELEEPLFNFTTEELPQIGTVKLSENSPVFQYSQTDLETVAKAINEAQFPLLMMGQQEEFIPNLSDELRSRMPVLFEIISNTFGSETSDKLETILATGAPPPYVPDLIIHIGGAFVCKHMKQFLRKQPNISVIRIGLEEEAPKTFGRVDFSVRTYPIPFLQNLTPLLKRQGYKHTAWENAIRDHYHQIKLPSPPQEKTLLLGFTSAKLDVIHVANSSSVRLLNKFVPGGYTPIFCNRGVNGIEGSLSTAAGHSLKTNKPVGCIIGDLSFFYDVNALWNTRLGKNLIILLLNNCRGEIFYKLEKLKDSPALNDYIAAHHSTTAKGICASYNINYMCKAATECYAETITSIIEKHLKSDAQRPLVIEVLL